MLDNRVHCSRCESTMALETAVDYRWYTCQCPRRIPVEDLDRIVLGLAYEHRRQLGDHEFLTLDDEPSMIERHVAAVRVGLDWSRPTVDWTSGARPTR